MLYKLLVIQIVFIVYSISQDIRSLELTELIDTEYQCTAPDCSPSKIVYTVMSLRDCQFACLAYAQCRTASFFHSINQCELFVDIPEEYGVLFAQANVITMVVIDSRQSTLPNINWLINGNAEIGPCELSSGITSPTGWNYSGLISQIYYNNTYLDLTYTTPGPSDRGNCYFYGEQSAVTSMWQKVNMTSIISPSLIDAQTIRFNFSAWIGGYQNQDDNAQASLTFADQNNQTIGNTTILGPVLAVDRGSITSLVFRQANGFIPIGARSFTVTVTMTRASGSYNDGVIDNIAVFLHQ